MKLRRAKPMYLLILIGAPWRFAGAVIIKGWRGVSKTLITKPLSPRQRMFNDCFKGLDTQPPETIEEIVVEISRAL